MLEYWRKMTMLRTLFDEACHVAHSRKKIAIL